MDDEIPRLVDLPAPNLQWKKQYVHKRMNWIALLASVYLHQGNCFPKVLPILMADENNFPSLNKLYHE